VIQGVRAQTVAFIPLEAVTTLLQAGLWATGDGRSNQSQLKLTGGSSQRFVVRLGSIRKAGKTTVCAVQLETVAEKFQPVLRATLEFTAATAKNRTQIRLEGSAAMRLGDGPDAVPTDEIRRMGNDYARQVLDEVAARIEKQAGKRAVTGALATVR